MHLAWPGMKPNTVPPTLSTFSTAPEGCTMNGGSCPASAYSTCPVRKSRIPDRNAHPARHDHLSIRTGDGVGYLRGFARLNHIRFVAQDPMLTGILQVRRLPGQSVFWRFLASLNLNLAGQLLQLQRILRERVWAAAHVGLKSITLDTDTTVHTLYGRQMGARKGYNPKNKGKKSYQPILTFIAETHEYV
jgi:hypothetical protein